MPSTDCYKPSTVYPGHYYKGHLKLIKNNATIPDQ